MNYLCVGNAACDILAKISPRQKKSNLRLILDDFTFHAGGDALNGAIDAKKMGENSMFIGCVGRDVPGDVLVNELVKNGVDIQYVRYSDVINTSVSYYILTDNGEKLSAEKNGNCYCPGGNEALTEQDVPDTALEWADHLHLGSPMIQDSLDGGGNARLLKRAKLMGLSTSMDLVGDMDEIWLPKIDEALHYCDIFIPSDYEVSYVCNQQDPLDMKEFFRPYGLQIFGVKMGKKGVFLTDYQQNLFMPSMYEGIPVDVLGAGDAFFTAFNIAYKRGYSLEKSARLGCAASACILGEKGATAGMRPFDDLLTMID